ncbi:tail protein X [Pseudovibrio sp. Tun.PSC04-5.I4]|uniref:tail protein X n=1 Tax=Pseudovibrio sp. Tun.PSC04-5.I4 TaxID=1798213 RepID=UPI00088DB37F|nr:tail protein X [Pseudovibrio sp. Tun.PSC04-5.I4]SDR01662.1 P2-like prophage tail protein X [Pseudovibrio sp. Tun.PSC04-5.I4]
MSKKITVTGEGITLDLLLVRAHGWRGQELIHEALQLNPGIAGEGPYLKQGRTVILPALPVQTSKTPAPTIDLFG